MSSPVHSLVVVVLLKVITTEVLVVTAEQRSYSAYSSYQASNLHHPRPARPVYKPAVPKINHVPSEHSPSFNHQFHGRYGYFRNDSFDTQSVKTHQKSQNTTEPGVSRNDPYVNRQPQYQHQLKGGTGEEKGKKETDTESDTNSEEETSKESDEEEESEEKGTKGKGEGGKEEEETSSEDEEEGAEGAPGTKGAGAAGGAAVGLVGTDFQPGRLVNIFFGLILMMFMLISQGYFMWAIGIAFLPGTRSLNEWQFNLEPLDRALDMLNSALDLYEEKMPPIEKLVSFVASLRS